MGSNEGGWKNGVYRRRVCRRWRECTSGCDRGSVGGIVEDVNEEEVLVIEVDRAVDRSVCIHIDIRRGVDCVDLQINTLVLIQSSVHTRVSLPSLLEYKCV